MTTGVGLVGARIPLKKHHTLSQYGYGGLAPVRSLSAGARRAALVRAVRAHGPTYVIRKLNVLAIYTKNTDPALSAKYRADMKFVQALVTPLVTRARSGRLARRR